MDNFKAKVTPRQAEGLSVTVHWNTGVITTLDQCFGELLTQPSRGEANITVYVISMTGTKKNPTFLQGSNF